MVPQKALTFFFPHGELNSLFFWGGGGGGGGETASVEVI